MLARRPWVPAPCEDLVHSIAAATATRDSEAIFHEIAQLVAENRRIHDVRGINLNPASNVMNPRAEAMMASGPGLARLARLPRRQVRNGARRALEVICAQLVSESRCVRRHGRERRPLGLAVRRRPRAHDRHRKQDPGHLTHHAAGAAALRVEDGARAGAGRRLHRRCGGSAHAGARGQAEADHRRRQLNLFAHPVAPMREVADEVAAKLLFDAAHLSGMVAGRTWANPLDWERTR